MTQLAAARVFALREAIARAGEAFAEFRSGTGVGAGSPPWDAVVLTCATESQATAAREELSRRRALGLFPAGCLLLALADPPPGRVGSGGATLLALEALAARWGEQNYRVYVQRPDIQMLLKQLEQVLGASKSGSHTTGG